MALSLNNPEMLNTLGQQKLFRGLSREELRHILLKMNAVSTFFEPGETISAAAEHHNGAGRLGLLLDGRALAVQYDAWGNRSILDYIMPGYLFGEAKVFGTGELGHMTLLADLGCSVLFLAMPTSVVGAERLWMRLQQNIINILAGRNHALYRKADILSRRTLREKLLAYLSYERDIHGSNEFDIPLSRQKLADYLYVDRSSLSTELGKLRREGLIQCRCSHFVLMTDGKS